MDNRSIARSLMAGSLLLLMVGLSWSQPAEVPTQPAFLRVKLPADAKLEFDGVVTKTTGEIRRFQSPPLATGKKYLYDLKWTYTEKGQAITKTRTVTIVPGSEVEIDLLVEEAKPEPKDPPKAEPKPAPKVEPKTEPKAEPKPEMKAEPKPAPKVEPKTEPKAEPKAEPKPAPKVEPKTEPKAEPKPEMKAEPKTAPKVEPKTEPKAEPKPAPKVEPKTEPKVEPKAEPKAEPKPAPKATGNDAEETTKVPYVPTPQVVVEAMLKMADVKAGDTVFDLGCGDGRIVITAVKQFQAKRGVGIDLDPDRILDSKLNAKKANVVDRVDFREGDVLKLKDLSEASVVTLYLLPEVNLKLKPVLLSTLKPGSRIVSHDFDMGDWKPEKTLDLQDERGDEHTIYLWTVPAAKN
ncbi:TIGR03000 domain-containing protein [Tuwongella immobilis]|uniref:Methyltransferase domain-containing protein n=1 Tax=Tuwongella immobilis TaxID=692036 RepID=A0A6C2YUP9_9BACT|nr:TIGR03000 domain-containing protein [Tuwongella immobilis]VIP05458.1 rna methyltransferase : Putative RNA methylase family UPF0020 OS=Oscillatoriales cyanobacterium JSC-12 GN=OsccyDRAFT_3039 PE=4 SV=1: Methyltransf_31 [Tuwongella immobilis]VTS08272.1 rna methyltransferase : Putative RNA methylase family UPF0020 OS=Oscillatoriales cyanobacterium JSC-12 GN=OsccyDRAFT_3039 PE=4 SV=1: Methyltransf_31 [Tuwongella immobilis]